MRKGNRFKSGEDASHTDVAIVVFDDILLLAKDDKLGRENKGG